MILYPIVECLWSHFVPSFYSPWKNEELIGIWRKKNLQHHQSRQEQQDFLTQAALATTCTIGNEIVATYQPLWP